MTTSREPYAPPDQLASGQMLQPTGPPQESEQPAVARLRRHLPPRSSTDRVVAGVCGGFAHHFRVDPTLVRLALVADSIWGGVGLLLYGVLAIAMRRDDNTTSIIEVGLADAVPLLLIVAAPVASRLPGWPSFNARAFLPRVFILLAATLWLDRRRSTFGGYSLSKS